MSNYTNIFKIIEKQIHLIQNFSLFQLVIFYSDIQWLLLLYLYEMLQYYWQKCVKVTWKIKN